MDGIERITTLETICSGIYYNLLEDDRKREDNWYSSYDLQHGLKHIIVDAVEYFIISYNPEGAWDKRVMDLIIKAYRPKTTLEQLNYLSRTIYSLLKIELGIFENGHRIAYRLENRVLRFHVLTPRRLG